MKRVLPYWLATALLSVWATCVAQITPYPWTPIGPKGDLVSSDQPIGVNGRIRSIEIRDLGGGDYYLYVGASSGGLWRSRNSTGLSVWSNLGSNMPNPAVGAFATHPSNPDDILVGTGDWNRYGGEGMIHTINAGVNWVPVALPVAPTSFFRILYLPGNPNIVLAASDQGLLRSTTGPDGPWQVVLSGVVSDLVIDPSNANTQYAWRAADAFLAGGVYKSVNAGMNWMRFTSDTDAPGNKVGRGSISICRDFPNDLVFLYETNGNVEDIVISTNAGSTWASIAGDFFSQAGPVDGDNQASHAQAIAFKPNDPAQIFVGTADFQYTSDGGQHWHPWGAAFKTHQDFNQLYFSQLTGDNGLWECNDGGIFLYSLQSGTAGSFNGNNVTGLQVSQLNAMDAVHNVRAIANQDDQISGSKDDGQTWSSYGCCDGQAVAVTLDVPGTESFWSVRSSGSFYGDVWYEYIGVTEWEVGDPNSTLGGLFFNRSDTRLYSINTNSALMSRYYGDTTVGAWNFELGLPVGSFGPVGDRLTGQRLFFWRGNAQGYLTLARKGGSSWFILRDSQISSNSVASVFASTESPGESWAVLRAATNSQVLHTTDDWQTSADITGNLVSFGPNALAWDIAVMPFNHKVIFIGADKGVFCTTDGGATWQPFQTGLPIVQCRRLRYVTDFAHNGIDKLVVGTYGHGLYERPIPRQPLVYVNQLNGGYTDGSFEHPLNSLNTGLSTTPAGGMMALDGTTGYLTSGYLNKPMTITAYESTAYLTH